MLPKLDIDFIGNFSDSLWTEIIPDMRLSGNLSTTLKASIDTICILKGEIGFKGFSLSTPLLSISGVGGRLPLKQTIAFKPLFLSKENIVFNPFYDQYRPYLSTDSYPVNNLSVKRLNIFNREISDLSADVYWENSYFRIPHYQVTLFEGNLDGDGWLKVDSLTTGKISYNITAQAAEINSDLISQLKTKGGKEAKISFNFNFSGRQFTPADPDFDFEGFLNIIKISPKVAENLLFALDPQQQDKGIQSTLYFLKKGWGISSFSFKASHGFVYSTIITQQPQIKKPLPFLVSRVLPLEREIKLSRLPLKFFIK
jgi:hypothetical protein